jgi:hypothetical protein
MFPGENLLGKEYLESSNGCFRIELANGTTLSVGYTPNSQQALGSPLWESLATNLTVNATSSKFQVRASMNKVSNILK